MTSLGPSKFAQIHASILARKGEARPWEEPANKKQWQREPVQPLPAGSMVYTPPPFQPTQKPLFDAIAPANRQTAEPEPRPAPKPMPEPRPVAEVKPLAEIRPTAPVFAAVESASVRAMPKPCDEMEFSDLSSTEPSRPYDPERIKKCTIRMSFIDYERLGIIAVKRNVTRQHLLHEALERCFEMAAEEYRKDCSCLGSREGCCQD